MKILLNFNSQVEAKNPWNWKKPVQCYLAPASRGRNDTEAPLALLRPKIGIVADFEKEFCKIRTARAAARVRRRTRTPKKNLAPSPNLV